MRLTDCFRCCPTLAGKATRRPLVLDTMARICRNIYIVGKIDGPEGYEEVADAAVGRIDEGHARDLDFVLG